MLIRWARKYVHTVLISSISTELHFNVVIWVNKQCLHFWLNDLEYHTCGVKGSFSE